MGTLIKKMEPHQNFSSNNPAAMIPIAAPAPAKPDQIAIALLRSSTGKITLMIDKVAGITRAAPTPIDARKKIS